MSVLGMVFGFMVLNFAGLAYTTLATYKAALQPHKRTTLTLSTVMVWIVILTTAFFGIADPVRHPTLFSWALAVQGFATGVYGIIAVVYFQKKIERKVKDVAASLVVSAVAAVGTAFLIFFFLLPYLAGWGYWIELTIPTPLPSPF